MIARRIVSRIVLACVACSSPSESAPPSTPVVEDALAARAGATASTASSAGEATGDATTEAAPAPAPTPAPPTDETEPPTPADPLAGFVDATPRCPAEAAHCYGLHVHVVIDDGAPVRDAAWIREQVALAQDRFGAAIDVAFEVSAVEPLSADLLAIESRLDRDRLGRPHFSRGVIHVFVVGSLADVDGPGEIRGVHWRDRSATERRWVILSSIAGPLTLTHELGHFFSLPHSRYPESVMNKGESPVPWGERGFHRREAARMRGARAKMTESAMLRPIVRAADPAAAAHATE